MLVYGVACKSCLTAIWSKHRHDYVLCSCEEIFVDGGRDYLRYGTTCETKEPVTVIIDTEYGTVWKMKDANFTLQRVFT